MHTLIYSIATTEYLFAREIKINLKRRIIAANFRKDRVAKARSHNSIVRQGSSLLCGALTIGKGSLRFRISHKPAEGSLLSY